MTRFIEFEGSRYFRHDFKLIAKIMSEHFPEVEAIFKKQVVDAVNDYNAFSKYSEHEYFKKIDEGDDE